MELIKGFVLMATKTTRKRERKSLIEHVDKLNHEVAVKKRKLEQAHQAYQDVLAKREQDPQYQQAEAEKKKKLEEVKLHRTHSQQQVALQQQIQQWVRVLKPIDSEASQWLDKMGKEILAAPVEFSTRSREAYYGMQEVHHVAEYTNRNKSLFRVVAKEDGSFSCRFFPEGKASSSPTPILPGHALSPDELERVNKPKQYPWSVLANDLDDDWLVAVLVIRFWKQLSKF